VLNGFIPVFVCWPIAAAPAAAEGGWLLTGCADWGDGGDGGEDVDIDGDVGRRDSEVTIVDAPRRYSSILSLYASLRDSIDKWPSLENFY
jgi:hypothetical protein